MTILNHSTTPRPTLFEDLAAGQTFMFQDREALYLKLGNQNGLDLDVNAVNLKTNSLSYFCNESSVILCESQVVITQVKG